MNVAMRHTQPSAGYLIGLRSGYWRPAARLQVLVLVQVSQCRVRDNDVLMSLSVSSTRRHCARGAASRGGLALLTAAAAARTVMEVTGSRVTVTRPRSRRSAAASVSHTAACTQLRLGPGVCVHGTTRAQLRGAGRAGFYTWDGCTDGGCSSGSG